MKLAAAQDPSVICIPYLSKNVSMEQAEYVIRTMKRDEIGLAVEWAAREGWNPGLHDADSFYAADPGGFLLGTLDGQPIATISAVRYGDRFGFIGFYMVTPEYRGKGYGLNIWNAAMKHLEGRTIGLDGVVDQQHNYRKSGFTLAHRNIRCEGKGGGSRSMGIDGIIPLNDLPFETVVSYDRLFFPAERTDFLRKWIGQEAGKALGYIREDRLSGYAVRRTCRSGHKIGPLFADEPEIARALIRSLISDLGRDEPYYLDIPEVNSAAVSLVDELQMKTVFETARMYKGPAPDLPLDRWYGVTTFELG